jgi:hypothetical protein
VPDAVAGGRATRLHRDSAQPQVVAVVVHFMRRVHAAAVVMRRVRMRSVVIVDRW